tara:strand:+ start:152 stop:388 length:237 start_codon:yes stop_codon:yes gene_type:complete
VVVLQTFLHQLLPQVDLVAAVLDKVVELVDQEQLVKEMMVVQVTHLKVVLKLVQVVVALVVLVFQELQVLHQEMVEMV